MASAQSQPRRRIGRDCPNCGIRLWPVIKAKVIQDLIEHIAGLAFGILVGVVIVGHYVDTIPELLAAGFLVGLGFAIAVAIVSQL